MRPWSAIVPGLLLLAVLGTNAAAKILPETQSSTPAAGPAAGVSIDDLVGTPPLAAVPPGVSVTLRRITYQPGGSLDLKYAGPVVYYVESGELAIRYAPGKEALLYSGPENVPPPLRASDRGETILTAGYAILAEDGALGPTRNAGDQPLLVLAVLLVPEDISGHTSSSAEKRAKPKATHPAG